MKIIPAIDLRGGRCVRLLQGDYARETVYEGDPVETARDFEAQGAEVIHVVDLDGARSGQMENLPTLRRIFAAVSVAVEVGGGVRTLETAEGLLEAGAARVVLGTALVRDPDLAGRVFERLGERAVAGIDARSGEAAVSGWTEGSGVSALGLARRMQELGARRVIVTDIATDGALTGPNVNLLTEFVQKLEMPVIASGGVGNLGHLRTLATLPEPGAEGVIVGRALYEGRFTVAEAIAAVA